MTQFDDRLRLAVAASRRPRRTRPRRGRRSAPRRRSRAGRSSRGSARGARAAARAARRAASRASRRRASAAAGPGRGSSGSRPRAPCCASRDDFPARSSQCSVSCFTLPPDSISSTWRSISCAIARSTKRNEFRFLSSVRVPSFASPTPPHRHVGVAAELALLHVGVGDVEVAQHLAQAAQVRAGLLGRVDLAARTRSRTAARPRGSGRRA